MFRRRRRSAVEPAEPAEPGDSGESGESSTRDETGAEALGGDGLTEPEPPAPPPAPKSERPDGPWDISEVEDPHSGRVDLGALLVPAAPGGQLRVDVDKASGQVVAATIVVGDSGLQLQAFAAPRSEGVWPEIRAELLAGITSQRGAAQEVEGPFGTELHARVPVALPEGKAGFQPLRFLGVDGPRWFLRGVLSGRAALDPTTAGDLESLFRAVVVVRGSEAKPPREPLALILPAGAQPVGGQAAGPGSAGRPGDPESATPQDAPEDPELNPFARGPEITELR